VNDRAASPGDGLAVLVNANAKRGGRRIAVQTARLLPGASVKLTRTEDEATEWLRRLLPSKPRVIFAAGGDGTAVALVNSLARVVPEKEPLPPLGLLKLGTGNAWANVLGAPKLSVALDILRRLHERDEPLPLRRFGLVDVAYPREPGSENKIGTLAHFAGAGWDAEILNDYKEQLEQSKGPPRFFAKSVYGYVGAMITRTAPKSILLGRAHVLIENLGDEVYTIDQSGALKRVEGQKHGTVLWDGLMSVAGAATCPEFGYHFRAYPFAERLLGMINVRVFDRSTLGGLVSIPKLWTGHHPLRGMHDWFTTAARFTFSRPMAIEVGGDALAPRRTVEMRASPRECKVLDWRALR
jgi:diacylglycerol kinase family enzyme